MVGDEPSLIVEVTRDELDVARRALAAVPGEPLYARVDLLNDDDWDFGPNIKARAEQVLAEGGLPDYPEEMKETFRKIMEEHNLDVRKFLGED